MSITRRNFMKTAAAGAAGMSISGPAVATLSASSLQQGMVWTDKMPINPDISNMRVICYHDEKMCPTSPNPDLFDKVNEAVDTERVSTVMDEMVVQLTGKATAVEAWKTIFRSGKPWMDTKVMIKVNSMEKRMMPRVAVIKKITDILTSYGVLPKNIVLFDAHGAGWAGYQNWISLTDATKIRGMLSNSYDALGGKASVNIPEISASDGPADLVNGVTDIIVNIAVNKGHNSTFNVGKTTLCLKNHFGTFLQNTGNAEHLHSTKGLINCNKIAEIIGGNPVRQQLCIIDSLWAIKQNVTGSASHKPDRLVMGTFAGAVDYYCAKEIREKLMNVTNHEQNVITQFLTAFGYAESDPEYVEMSPSGITIGYIQVSRSPWERLQVNVHNHGRFYEFRLEAGVAQPVEIRIMDMQGRLIWKNRVTGENAVVWNRETISGSRVPEGIYSFLIRQGNRRLSGMLMVSR